MPRTKPKAPRRLAPSRAPSSQHRGVVAGLPYAVTELMGRREYMEDAHAVHSVVPDEEETTTVGAGSRQLRAANNKRGSPPTLSSLFGVFDGHGGAECAKFCTENLLKELASHRSFVRSPHVAIRAAFQEVDQTYCRHALKQDRVDGSTATVALIHHEEEEDDKKNASSSSGNLSAETEAGGAALDQPKIRQRLLLANVGDSRAVLVSSSNSVEVLCRDHNCDHEDERDRIRKQGGMVVYDEQEQMYRVQGVLAVSRAFGNAYFKPFVSHVPEIHDRVLTDEHTFLCIASDGLWECVKNNEVGPILSKYGIHAGTDALAQLSYSRGGSDNITVMCVDLRGGEGGRTEEEGRTEEGALVLDDDDDDDEEEEKGNEPKASSSGAKLSRDKSFKRKRVV